MQPASSKDHLKSKNDKEDQEDKTATAPSAGTTTPKTEAVLEPIKDHVQH